MLLLLKPRSKIRSSEPARLPPHPCVLPESHCCVCSCKAYFYSHIHIIITYICIPICVFNSMNVIICSEIGLFLYNNILKLPVNISVREVCRSGILGYEDKNAGTVTSVVDVPSHEAEVIFNL